VAGALPSVEELSVTLKLAAAAVAFAAVLAGSFEGAVEKTVVEGFWADFVPEVAAAAVGAVGLAMGLAVELVKPVLRALLQSAMEVAKDLAVAAVFVRPEGLVNLDYSIRKRRAAWPYVGSVAVAQHAAGLKLGQLGVGVVASAAAEQLAAVVYEVEGPEIGPNYWQ